MRRFRRKSLRLGMGTSSPLGVFSLGSSGLCFSLIPQEYYESSLSSISRRLAERAFDLSTLITTLSLVPFRVLAIFRTCFSSVFVMYSLSPVSLLLILRDTTETPASTSARKYWSFAPKSWTFMLRSAVAPTALAMLGTSSSGAPWCASLGKVTNVQPYCSIRALRVAAKLRPVTFSSMRMFTRRTERPQTRLPAPLLPCQGKGTSQEFS